jgi:hypothetical protein
LLSFSNAFNSFCLLNFKSSGQLKSPQNVLQLFWGVKEKTENQFITYKKNKWIRCLVLWTFHCPQNPLSKVVSTFLSIPMHVERSLWKLLFSDISTSNWCKGKELHPTFLSIHLPHYTANHNEIIHLQFYLQGGGAVLLLEIILGNVGWSEERKVICENFFFVKNKNKLCKSSNFLASMSIG